MISTRDRLIAGFMAISGLSQKEAELAADNSASINDGRTRQDFLQDLLKPVKGKFND